MYGPNHQNFQTQSQHQMPYHNPPLGQYHNVPQNVNSQMEQTMFGLVYELIHSPQHRGQVLQSLAEQRENLPNLAPTLWYSTGCMCILLQEIVQVYELLTEQLLTKAVSTRVCNAMALLQCIAGHQETRKHFLLAHISLFLYPFLNTTIQNEPFEILRLTSLGVLGAFVKHDDDDDVVQFLLTTELIPLCLRIMETGEEITKTVATVIIHKVLLHDRGLGYVCQTPERLYAVGSVLTFMISKKPSSRLLKYIIRCYLRLSAHPLARQTLQQHLPEQLKDDTFSKELQEDEVMKRWLSLLLMNIGAYDLSSH